MTLSIAGLAPSAVLLKPFQIEGVHWLRSRRAALLADQMRLGKSVQSIIAIRDGAPVIVSCPATLKDSWKDEFKKWRPEFKVTILAGRNSFRWPEPGEVIIINYDILAEELPGKPPSGLHVIGDEATAVKSNKSKRHKRFEKLCTSALKSGGKAWLLTGTPIMGSPYELWNLLKTADLNNEAFGHFGKFLYLFNGVQGKFGITYGLPRPEVRDLLRKVMLRRTAREVLPQMPEPHIKDIRVDLPKDVKAICDKAVDILKANGIDLEGALENVDVTKLAGADFEEVAAARKALSIAKIPALLELVEQFEEAGEPLLVFSAHRPPVDLLGERAGWEAISGGVKVTTRPETVKRFQTGITKGVAMTIRSGGMGLTLTRASNIVFVDLDWVPDMNKQAMARPNSVDRVTGFVVTRIIGNHILDDRTLQVLDMKTDLTDATIDQGPVAVSPDAFEAAS